MGKLENQQCPFCKENALTLMEEEMDIPYFGKTFLFSMTCSNCRYSKSDVEAETPREPLRYTVEVDSEDDMKIRVVKSSEATIKIPQLKASVTPGPASSGYVTNVEGILDRFAEIIKGEVDDDEEANKVAKRLLKKIRRAKCGSEKLRIVLDDPTGNSAIISEKAKIEKLGGKPR